MKTGFRFVVDVIEGTLESIGWTACCLFVSGCCMFCFESLYISYLSVKLNKQELTLQLVQMNRFGVRFDYLYELYE